MEIKNIEVKKISIYIALLILFSWALNNHDIIIESASKLWAYLTPVVVGCVIAFIINVPMSLIEKKFFAKYHGKKFVRPTAMVITVLFFVLIISAVLFIVVPELTESIKTLAASAQPAINDLLARGEQLARENPDLFAWINEHEFNWMDILNNAISGVLVGMENVLSSTISMASVLFNGIFTFVVALAFAAYILADKEKFASRGKTLLFTVIKKQKAERLVYILNLTYQSFAKFLAGQCTEAVIIGVLFFIAMTLFGFSYTLMISVLIGFTALIPIFGGIIGCAIGSFVLFIESPMSAVWFIVLFVVIQQLEGNLIYPRVVGGSIGLPALWVLLAVSLGGSIMGLVGMLIFIPIFSICYTLLWEYVDAKNPTAIADKGQKDANDSQSSNKSKSKKTPTKYL